MKSNLKTPMASRSLAVRVLRATLLIATVALGLAVVADPVGAAAVVGRKPMLIDVDQAELVQLPQPATTVFVANPDIADVQVPNTGKFLIFGKKPGTTTVYAMYSDGKVTSYSVTVKRPVADIAAALREQVPGAQITVTSMPGGITVNGTVASPREAQKLKAVARDFLGDKDDIVFNVNVTGATQVNLRVRVAEVARTANKQFGFNWSAIFNNGTIAIGLLTGRPPVSSFGNFLASPSSPQPDSFGFGGRSNGGSVNINSMIDALQTEGIVTILAEPNLTASSGETANFLAGGEFPIPIAQGNNTISIEFKHFGVSVDFTPTVLDANRMSIKVRPEVSQLSDAGAITIDSVKIPGIAIRRAETTVELASGQSFAIAGLFQNNVSTQIQQFPWLGDIPILGTLFRSTQFQRKESELVIIVTPYIVQPAAKPSDIHVPTEGLVFSSDIEQVLMGRMTAASGRPAGTSPASAGTPHLHGAAGFMLEQ